MVIIGMLLAYFLSRGGGQQPFRITGNITAGLPPFRPPPFSTHTHNGTFVPFVEMVQTVGATLASTAMVAILEMVAISKAFCKDSDSPHPSIPPIFANISLCLFLLQPRGALWTCRRS